VLRYLEITKLVTSMNHLSKIVKWTCHSKEFHRIHRQL